MKLKTFSVLEHGKLNRHEARIRGAKAFYDAQRFGKSFPLPGEHKNSQPLPMRKAE
jgi:hypothetical protein